MEKRKKRKKVNKMEKTSWPFNQIFDNIIVQYVHFTWAPKVFKYRQYIIIDIPFLELYTCPY